MSALVKRRSRPVTSSGFASRLAGLMALGLPLASGAASAQEGALLSELENQVLAATRDWQATVFEAARSLFWILASIEIGLAAVWLALAAASLDTWFAELVRRILFVGFFALLLEQGPDFARAVVDSLFQIGASQGSASPAEVFDAGIRVASVLSENARFGVFEDNALAIASVIAMGVVVICFSLVAAIFVAVMVEMRPSDPPLANLGIISQFRHRRDCRIDRSARPHLLCDPPSIAIAIAIAITIAMATQAAGRTRRYRS